ncbi:GNAT family protein [Bacillus paranthracis]|uniref:GNAT family N-acetyltransferase n=1 Tax=Bacillus TaxID=1386 RepID=UPI0022E45443|nr:MULTISPECIES: GNAT family protein [Bacillus cereus group]MDA1742926.1 GNAT family protein [Bacillus cereus group sp. LD121LC]MDK7418316.1 GNAT family protein [Bacillus paranthracis]MDK7429857.1 GNAT family protein [Bacillus paranthracis]MDK7515868.1 GNAT family protein [Bacillus paranthracis]MDK7574356.1 GNAT family protein [Bacillus paranthracis]
MKLPLLQVETERLMIRPFQNDDYESWLDGFHKRLPSQYKYDDGYQVMASSTKEWFTEWIRGFDEAAHRDEMYVLGIFRMNYQWAMMGYSIHNQYWKNGYGMESVKAAVSLFFNRLHFHRIELHIRVDNEPSVRLAERAGFSFECKREAFSLENGKWMDFLIYFKNKEMNI